jgi:hypothetical protein
MAVNQNLQYDVFRSHSAENKVVVRPLAEFLREDGMEMWFDERECSSLAGAAEGGRGPGDGRGAQKPTASQGRSTQDWNMRVCRCSVCSPMPSGRAAQLVAGTSRLHDTLNQERRFVLLQLDDVRIKGSLAQHLCVNWRPLAQVPRSQSAHAANPRYLRFEYQL